MAQAGRSNHGDDVCVAASSWHVPWLCLEVVTSFVVTCLVLTSRVLTSLVQLRRGRLCLGGSVCALGYQPLLGCIQRVKGVFA